MPLAPDLRMRRQQRRTRLFSLLLLVGAVAVLALIPSRRSATQRPPEAPTTSVTVSPGGEAASLGGLRLLSLSGTAGDVGRQYGNLLRAPLRRVVDEWLAAGLDAKGLTREQARGQARGMAGKLPQTLIDSLHGLAETSGVAYDDLLALQAFPELIAWGRSCAFAALSPATRNRDLLVGYNLDLTAPPALTDGIVALAVDEEGLPAYAGVTFAGLLAPLAGFNEQGLAVALLAVDGGSHAGPDGVPWLVLVRRLLHETASIDAARQLLEQANRTVSANLVVAQTAPKPDAAVIEALPAKLGFRASDQGRVVATNHLRALQQAPLEDDQTGTCERFDRLRAWLLDRAGTLGPLSRPIRQAGSAGPESLVAVQLQPMTGQLAAATGALASEQEPVELAWDAATGQLAARRAAGPGAP